ncbi:hypothetical protein GRF29_28g1685929 [Pseudopithomyces chartarum]|uniref:AB hydrolase-1 domain-containing protein n=1 Tax=Pseudopithomyces chartarum TaxID=1892770 RepID=A0AAN6M043_9PLEO|nr:hypothetical protein GRF29_28g1685929 [Pseudopithomyces chartarum]
MPFDPKNLHPAPQGHNASHQSSEEDLPPFPEPEVSSIILEGKPGAKLAYTYYAASESKPNKLNPFAKSLVVFLNGLVQPRASWNASLQAFLEKRITNRLPYPAILTYDRYGQGESDRDPDDPKDEAASHGHDIMSVVHTLRQFTLQIWKEHLDISNPTEFPSLVFVGNSIGCATARLFAQTYPGTVLGLLLLDSVIANTDFISLWPDPDAPSFNPAIIPPELLHPISALRAPTWRRCSTRMFRAGRVFPAGTSPRCYPMRMAPN